MGGGATGKQATILRSAAFVVLAFAPGAAAYAGDGLVPSGFFDAPEQIGAQDVSVTSDQLTYDADHHQVIANGDVSITYNGATYTGDHLVFDQRAHTAHFVGHVTEKAANGEVYTAEDLQLSSPLRQALMQQLTMTTKDGALVTAGDGDFQTGKDTVLHQATYSPCGQCIDSKGRKIGWTAKSVTMVYHNKTKMVTMEQPSLYLLGVPVAWLPWLTIPDPTKRVAAFRMPSVDYSPQFGARVNAPYFIPVDDDTDLILTPSLMSRQGFLMSGQWDHRFPGGQVEVKASAIDQLDPDAYSNTVGDRQWRGEAQISGMFTPYPTWTVGWSYTAFTDAQYFSDYHINDDKNSINQVWATHLAGNEFIDFRLQQFNLLGNVTAAQEDQQAKALPNALYHNVLYLPHDLGEIDLTANLLGVTRGADSDLGTVGGVHYVTAYAETKAHAMVEADWQKRYVVPGGIAVTPLVGLRGDAAYYDGSSSNLKPGQIDLLNATPIAAVDVRYPWIARAGSVSQVIEPIAQLVYRASDVSDVGITNDNAQSFVFDDTNLFSYNRFSGTDRQETGLRANVGAHYQANFDNGSWIDLLGGQSFQLAGTNAFAETDPAQTTTGQGLSASNSYMVVGAKGSPFSGLNFGSKLQYDPNQTRITRAGIGGTYDIAGIDFAMDYFYVAQDLERGVTQSQTEISSGVSVPVFDYWRAAAHASWDLAANKWLDAGGGIHYDDGYLRYGADVEATGPTNTTPNDLRVTGSFYLKGFGGPDS